MSETLSTAEDVTQFQRLLEAAPDAMVVVNEGGVIEFVNAQAERAFGYRRDELVGQRVEMLLPERYRGTHVRDRTSYFASPVARLMGDNREVSGRRKDGTEVTLEVNLAPIEMERGRRVLAAVRDVSARKRLEAERTRLAAIVESTDDAIISMTEDGVITTWNYGAQQLFGYTADEVVGRHHGLLIPPETMAEWDGLCARARGGERVRQYETIRRRKDGTDLHVALTMSPLYDAVTNTRGFSKVLRDITERTRAEDRFRLAVEAAPNAMIMMDAERKIALVNSQTEKLFGYDRAELLGQPIEVLVPLQFREKHPQYVEGFLAAPSPRAMGAGRELFGRRKDGSEVPVEIGLNPLVSENGILVLASVIDISERVDTMRQLRALNEDLKQKNHENEMFVYAVSHDLRSPLVNLQGFSTELEEACNELRGQLEDPGVPAEVRDASTAILDEGIAQSIKFIRTAVSRLSSIIDSLLRLSRLGRIEYRWQTVDVQQIVQRLVDATAGTIEQRGATVTVRELPSAWSDPSAIEQIFGNLFGNALNYLGPEPGTGTIEFGTVDEPTDALNKTVTYYVKDNGQGIPANCLDKVFQAFQRIKPGGVPGEGMGLTFVRRVVARHNGRVWVESTLGEGSTFYVTLPVAPIRPKLRAVAAPIDLQDTRVPSVGPVFQPNPPSAPTR